MARLNEIVRKKVGHLGSFTKTEMPTNDYCLAWKIMRKPFERLREMNSHFN